MIRAVFWLVVFGLDVALQTRSQVYLCLDAVLTKDRMDEN